MKDFADKAIFAAMVVASMALLDVRATWTFATVWLVVGIVLWSISTLIDRAGSR